MSSIKLESISDYYRRGYDLRVTCVCGHIAVIDSIELTQLCQRRGWSRMIDKVQYRLKCSNCGGQDIECSPTFRDD